MRAVLPLLVTTLMVAASNDSYTDQATKWRDAYEESLKAPDGWLSVAGLFWLHPGANVIGSDPQSVVVLPASAPKRAGVLRFDAGKVIFENASGEKTLMKSDATKQLDVTRIGDLTFTIIERGGKTGVRLRDPHAETLRNFAGCVWFPASEAWRLKARWVAYPEPKMIRITNVLGMTDEQPSPGYAEFASNGKKLRLEPVTEDGQLFFIFKDATSGKTTYGAGRFLYAPMPKGEEVTLDFNQSQNPPCAYTAYATCPLPPKQNWLAVAIEAGEKNYGHRS
jgi:uncharacterized protein (DUF1684 family)